MKKLTVLVVIFALLGLLFANQIIPSVGVRDVAAYPPPSTSQPTVMPPDGPGDIFYWRGPDGGYPTGPLGALVAECALCVVNYSENVYRTFVVKFTVWDTELGWVQRYGTYTGRDVMSNRAVYTWHIALAEQYLDGCFVVGPPQSAQLYQGSVPLGAPTFTYTGPSSPRRCGLTMPLILQQ